MTIEQPSDVFDVGDLWADMRFENLSVKEEDRFGAPEVKPTMFIILPSTREGWLMCVSTDEVRREYPIEDALEFVASGKWICHHKVGDPKK